MESIEEKVREVVDEDVPVRRGQYENKIQCNKNLSLPAILCIITFFLGFAGLLIVTVTI